MKITTAFAFLSLPFCYASVAQAVNFDWATVGNPRNNDDDTGYGAVDYAYRISKHEVTNAQYVEFLNVVADDDPNDLYHRYMDFNEGYNGGISQSGEIGSFVYMAQIGRENIPVSFVNFWDIARFANWLHNDQFNGPQGPATTEDGAYTITSDGIANNTITRNPGAKVFIPTEDEWYKAAYYQGGGTNAGYWDYPTGSNAAPTAESPPGGANSANYNSVIGDHTDVGEYTSAASPYGTFDQGGNISEWVEDIVSSSRRGLRGGGQESGPEYLIAAGRDWLWADGDRRIGFRVAAAIPDSADFDEDGDVDGADFLAWQRGESPNPLSSSDLAEWQAEFSVPVSGDFDNDGDVDGADFLYWQLNDGSESNLDLWQANFGNVASAMTASSTGVPESSTLLLSLLGLSAVGIIRRRFRK